MWVKRVDFSGFVLANYFMLTPCIGGHSGGDYSRTSIQKVFFCLFVFQYPLVTCNLKRNIPTELFGKKNVETMCPDIYFTNFPVTFHRAKLFSKSCWDTSLIFDKCCMSIMHTDLSDCFSDSLEKTDFAAGRTTERNTA